MSGIYRTLAIDPGNTESAYALIDTDTCRPIEFDKLPNERLRFAIPRLILATKGGPVAVEMIASYGMAVGQEVFDTCVWVGRFSESIRRASGSDPVLTKRRPVKLHHTHSSKATDANVNQALKDRFALGVRNHGKGTKDNPGWFYGFSKDVWAAYAVAVFIADETLGREVA
jgi:hypothetical protein